MTAPSIVHGLARGQLAKTALLILSVSIISPSPMDALSMEHSVW